MNIEVAVYGELDVAEDVEDIADRAGDMRPVLKRVRDVLIAGHAKQFASKGAYLGSSWPPLAEATVAKKGDSDPLVRTGALRTSLTGGRGRKTSVRKTGVDVGSKVWYAHFLHGGTQRGIPARPLVGMAEGQEKAAIWLMERYLVHGIA